MKKMMRMTTAIFMFALLVASCSKEPAATVATSTKDNTGKTPKATSSNDATQNRIVSLCGRKFNYVEPPTGTWALSIKVDNVIQKIGVPTLGDVSFTNIDWVKFEFSGQYADAANTIKLYRIRRNSDGKCLTWQWGLEYLEMNQQQENGQLWAFEGMPDNAYRFTIAKYNSTSCVFANTLLSDGEYKIGGTYLNGASPGVNFLFYFSPLNSLPPNSN